MHAPPFHLNPRVYLCAGILWAGQLWAEQAAAVAQQQQPSLSEDKGRSPPCSRAYIVKNLASLAQEGLARQKAGGGEFVSCLQPLRSLCAM